MIQNWVIRNRDGIRNIDLNPVVFGVSSGIILLFVLLMGPTLFLLDAFVENVGNYLDNFFALAFWNETDTGGSWQNGWSAFYRGWWIAWSPFVGLFIARILRGRTIRRFVTGCCSCRRSCG
jgi:choline/glycine/proline betaine transport protein